MHAEVCELFEEQPAVLVEKVDRLSGKVAETDPKNGNLGGFLSNNGLGI
jgi:hypothetical protein